MAAYGTLKIGDTVTHSDWPNGEHRKVVDIQPFTPHPDMPKTGGKERVVELDRPAFEKGFDTNGIDGRPLSQNELALNIFWMEAGLLKV